jgi:hypothetical protein
MTFLFAAGAERVPGVEVEVDEHVFGLGEKHLHKKPWPASS